MKNFKYTFATILCGLFLFAHSPDLKADHIFGAQMSYVYKGDNEYDVILQLYRFGGGIPLLPSLSLNVRTPTGQLINESGMVINQPITINLQNDQFIPILDDPCFTNPPEVPVEIGLYRTTIVLPDDPGVYNLYIQDCCRSYDIINIFSQSVGATYAIDIPHNIIDPPNDVNNTSALFVENPPLFVCVGAPFIYDHSAFDADNDSLVYGLYTPFLNGPFPNFGEVSWITPFNVDNQMGGDPPMSIDSETGILTANPDTPGQYAIGVQVEEWRDGNLICTNRRDYQFNVTQCDQVQVTTGTSNEKIELVGIGEYEVNDCTSLTYTFDETSPGNNPLADTIIWLGLENIPGLFSNLTSPGLAGTAINPQFTFPFNGTYELQFTANVGTCADTATVVFNMNPPSAIFESTSGCGDNTIQFTNESFGVADSVLWDFGDPNAASIDNQSKAQNPEHTYTQEGTYFVSFTTFVGNCSKETIESVVIAPPFLANLSSDVPSVCQGDPVVLTGNTIGGDGSAIIPAWPADAVINPTPGVMTATINPTADTWLYFEAETASGCRSVDSVFVEVLDIPQIDLPTQMDGICEGKDTLIEANVPGTYTSLIWSPTTNLTNETTLTPIVTPSSDPITYTLTVDNDICNAEASINIAPVGPVSVNLLNEDETICEGTPITLEAQSTETVTWIGEGIDNSNASVQTITPSDSTNTYEVMVANECFTDSKTVTISVDEQPILDAGDDISLGYDESAPLQGTSNLPIIWDPPTGLTDPTDPNTIAKPERTTDYRMTSTNGECYAEDIMKVTVSAEFTVNVPSAFTPNGDGLNDVVNITTNGIESIRSFDVYNRWGELVYSGTGMDAAWDGFYESEAQPVGVYVYYIVAVTVLGDELMQPGQVTLIR